MPPRPFFSHNQSSVPSLVLVVLLAVFAGVVGTLFALPHAVQMLADKNLAESSVTLQTLRGRGTEVSLSTLVPSTRASVLFAAPKLGTDFASSSYVPGDAVAMGIVVTSDGWIASVEPGAAKRRLLDSVAIVAGKSYKVTKVVPDTFSGVTFVKVAAENLPVVAFGQSSGIVTGDEVFTLDASGAIHRIEVLANDAQPARSYAEVLRSSELSQRRLRLSAVAGMPGAMVLDGKGEIIGLASGAEGFGASALPYESFSAVIGSVLRGQPIARPFLGVHYAELSLLAARSADTPNRGALLTATPDGRASVLRGSPAAVSGLRAGDIITAIDGEQLTAKNTLAEALASYAPGEKVALTVQRGSAAASLEVLVTLGTAPAK